VPRLHCLVHRKLSVNDLISSSPTMEVYLRVDSVAVGKLSLNLSGFDKSSIFNTASLAPVKDYETNRLVPGALQCAEGSHLTVDEIPLQSGTLNNNGVENARLLKDLLDFQKV
ncbi:minichromosome maintenance complex-binding protein, partial [Tanacetum coccineum]